VIRPRCSYYGPVTGTWITDKVYDVLGTAFRIRADDPAIGRRLEQLFTPFRAEDLPVPPENNFSLVAHATHHRLVHGETTLLSTEAWPWILERLMTEINQTALEGFDGLACHASVVALGDRAIAFPASSGGGKSTLAAACLLGGFEYVSDEALCLELASGRVIPYPKPCGLSATSRTLLGLGSGDPAFIADGHEALVTAEDLGGRVASGHRLELREVVLAERADSPSVLKPLSGADVVTAVLRYSFNHYKRPEASFRLMVEVAKRCRGWRLAYRDPRQAADLLREALT
jgi:hypothetical protein